MSGGPAPPLAPAAADWEGIWAAGLKPGDRFDMSREHPFLAHCLGRPSTLPTGFTRVDIPAGRALVPGCGRGYDVVALASPGRHVTGLELSATAAGVADEYVRSQGVPPDRYQIRNGDFFELVMEPVDFVYDYTFLCALPRHRRGEWAAKMAALLRLDGILLTLQFPLVPYPLGATPDEARGPPFQLSHDMYRTLLEPAGFDLVVHGDIPPDISDPRRAGAECYAVWRRRA